VTTQIDMRHFDTIITPKGVSHRPRSFTAWADAVHHSAVKVLYLIGLGMKQQSFGLTFGHLWLILEPSLQAAAYFFLIRFVLGVGGEDMTFAFFFTAITFWRSHATLVTSAPYLLVTKGQAYVEQNMSLDTAYLETIAQEVALFLIRLIVLSAFLIAAGQPPSVTWLFVFPLGIVMFTFSSALTLWLSVLGLYTKDAGKFVGHIVWLWWYLSPGLYTIKRIPEWFLPIYKANPFAHIIPALHQTVLREQSPSNPIELMLIFVLSVAVLCVGWHVVRKVAYQVARLS
jgi:lipopolysaccharide transport system permease protein